MVTTKTELISLIREDTGVKRDTIKMVFDSIFATITEQLKNGEAVRIDGFGKFVPEYVEEKDISYLRNGEKTIVPAHYQVKFRQFKSFKNKVNGIDEEETEE